MPPNRAEKNDTIALYNNEEAVTHRGCGPFSLKFHVSFLFALQGGRQHSPHGVYSPPAVGAGEHQAALWRDVPAGLSLLAARVALRRAALA